MTDTPHIRAIVMSDTDGVIRHWSDGAERFFGYSVQEAQGQSLDLIVPPDYRDRHWEGFRRAMTTGECESDRSATNLPVKCKDDVIRIFPARFVFLQDVHGGSAGALAIYSRPEGSEQPSGSVLPLTGE